MLLARYIIRDVIMAVFAVCLVLLVLTVFGRLSDLLGKVVEGSLARDYLLPMVIYRLPQFLELILPFSMFLGVLIALRRLYADSEMSVIFAAGISEWDLLRFTLLPIIVVSALVAILSLYLTPLSMQRAYHLLTDANTMRQAQQQSVGRFQISEDSKRVSYIETMDQDSGAMGMVFVAQIQSEETVDGHTQLNFHTTIAPGADSDINSDTGDQQIRFIEGHHYRGTFGRAALRITDYQYYVQRVPGSVNLPKIKADAIATAELINSESAQDQADLHWRLSLPALTLIAAILALPLSRSGPRGNGNLGLLPAVVLFITYLICLGVTRVSVDKGDLPWGAYWIIHGLMLSWALILLSNLRRRLRPTRQRPTLLHTGAALE